MELTSAIDDQNGSVTAQATDSSGNVYTSIIGLASAPNPSDAADPENLAYYLSYIESTIPPTPTAINLGD